MRSSLVIVVLLAACRDEPPPPRDTEKAPRDKVLREASDVIREGKAFVKAHEESAKLMDDLKADGTLDATVLLADCRLDVPDEQLVANRARLKPFIARLRATAAASTDCSEERRELAEEIVAALKH